jgi:hypothetical protein
MKTLLVFILILLFACTAFSETQDSIMTQQAVENNNLLIQSGDTLVNLNKLNGGIIRFQISDEDKEILKNNGLQITDQAAVIVNDLSLLGKLVMLEIKTFASDKEWYINTLKIESKSSGVLVYVASDKIEMATGWRKDGKIFVVIAVIAVLFLGVIGYLFMLDRKIARLKN